MTGVVAPFPIFLKLNEKNNSHDLSLQFLLNVIVLIPINCEVNSEQLKQILKNDGSHSEVIT